MAGQWIIVMVQTVAMFNSNMGNLHVVGLTDLYGRSGAASSFLFIGCGSAICNFIFVPMLLPGTQSPLCIAAAYGASISFVPLFLINVAKLGTYSFVVFGARLPMLLLVGLPIVRDLPNALRTDAEILEEKLSRHRPL